MVRFLLLTLGVAVAIGVSAASAQTGGTAASSGLSQSVFITVQGKSRFTVDEVNDLMEQLIERQRDGAQLVLVR